MSNQTQLRTTNYPNPTHHQCQNAAKSRRPMSNLRLCTWILCGAEDPDVKLDVFRRKDVDNCCKCTTTWSGDHVAYRCNTCGIWPSSCMCVECFDRSQHEGHDFRMYSSASGGCCDCGDPAAWKREGFCKRHQLAAARAIDPVAVLGESKLAAETVIGTVVALLVPLWQETLQGYDSVLSRILAYTKWLHNIANVCEGLRTLVSAALLDSDFCPEMPRRRAHMQRRGVGLQPYYAKVPRGVHWQYYDGSWKAIDAMSSKVLESWLLRMNSYSAPQHAQIEVEGGCVWSGGVAWLTKPAGANDKSADLRGMQFAREGQQDQPMPVRRLGPPANRNLVEAISSEVEPRGGHPSPRPVAAKPDCRPIDRCLGALVNMPTTLVSLHSDIHLTLLLDAAFKSEFTRSFVKVYPTVAAAQLRFDPHAVSTPVSSFPDARGRTRRTAWFCGAQHSHVHVVRLGNICRGGTPRGLAELHGQNHLPTLH